MNRTTLCYIDVCGKLLMLHRTKKKNDENAGMYIGLGGHFLPGETPEQCVRREVYEEAGVTPDKFLYRGVVHFSSDVYEDEDMYLFTASCPAVDLPACDEGELCLITKEELLSLPTWAGDRIFLHLLFEGAPVFELSLRYEGRKLVRAVLDGKELPTD